MKNYLNYWDNTSFMSFSNKRPHPDSYMRAPAVLL